jgi:DNA repair protein RadC
MGGYPRTRYPGNPADADGWTLEGPDAVAMFVRWLGKDVAGCTVAVMLDRRYRVVGCNIVAETRIEASRLTSRSVLMHVREAGAQRFILARSRLDVSIQPTRQEVVVTRSIGLSASHGNVPMVDHIIVGTDGGYWSAWAHNAVNW